MKSNFFHKYIKNASTHGMILTEYLLNAGKKPQPTERARKSPCKLGSRKKKENNKVRKDESGTVLHPGKGAVKEERFLYPGKPPHRQRGWLGQNGSFRASEENAAAGGQQSEKGENSTNGRCHHPVLSLRHASMVWAGCWNLGFRDSTQGEDWGWLCEHSLGLGWVEAGIQCNHK